MSLAGLIPTKKTTKLIPPDVTNVWIVTGKTGNKIWKFLNFFPTIIFKFPGAFRESVPSDAIRVIHLVEANLSLFLEKSIITAENMSF